LLKEVHISEGSCAYEALRKLAILKNLNIYSCKIRKYPLVIIKQFIQIFERLLSFCENAKGWSQFSEDVYWKDLALVSFNMFPAGERIVEHNSGFSRKMLINNGVMQMQQYIAMLLKTRGNEGFYQTHIHSLMTNSLNFSDWVDCYLTIARMLKRSPNTKGVFGSSWFYDPRIMDISPHLGYLQKVPLDNGAFCFYVAKDYSENAIVKSLTRRRLFEQNSYTPKEYLLVWPRKDIIKWAESL